MSPCLDGETIVRLRVTAWAPLGMPQLPWMRKNWDGPPGSGLPLVCDPTVRVSKTRHGVTAKYWKGPPAHAGTEAHTASNNAIHVACLALIAGLLLGRPTVYETG